MKTKELVEFRILFPIILECVMFIEKIAAKKHDFLPESMVLVEKTGKNALLRISNSWNRFSNFDFFQWLLWRPF